MTTTTKEQQKLRRAIARDERVDALRLGLKQRSTRIESGKRYNRTDKHRQDWD